MSAMSNYLEAAILNHILRNSSFTSPTTVYLGLFTSDPGEALGSPSGEIVGFGYARQACAFDAPSSAVSVNSATEQFTASGGNWGSITHWALFDAAVDGNMLIYGTFDTPRTVNDGDTFQVAAGDLAITAA